MSRCFHNSITLGHFKDPCQCDPPFPSPPRPLDPQTPNPQTHKFPDPQTHHLFGKVMGEGGEGGLSSQTLRSQNPIPSDTQIPKFPDPPDSPFRRRGDGFFFLFILLLGIDSRYCWIWCCSPSFLTSNRSDEEEEEEEEEEEDGEENDDDDDDAADGEEASKVVVVFTETAIP
ncbi:hypothetical protein Pmani_026558 [Petrolisthes manimaculis]|uniref:Uncharacterized protein n=1 Tax=Petrolisthes manimaculis TaxID=1843537 RepID=A0AAE1P3F6_9EUCA|nr:hypothetical protein Pmani_026558 [Petrolisthes manimaculis]